MRPVDAIGAYEYANGARCLDFIFELAPFIARFCGGQTAATSTTRCQRPTAIICTRRDSSKRTHSTGTTSRCRRTTSTIRGRAAPASTRLSPATSRATAATTVEYYGSS